MRDAAADIATIIEAGGLGLTQGTNLFIGPMPEDDDNTVPDKCVAVMMTGGAEPIVYLNGTVKRSVFRPQVTVRIRGNREDYSDGQALAFDIFNIVHLAVASPYIQILANESAPFYGGTDGSDRHLWSLNVDLEYQDDGVNGTPLSLSDSGNRVVPGNLSVAGNLDVAGNLSVGGSASFSGALTSIAVEGATFLGPVIGATYLQTGHRAFSLFPAAAPVNKAALLWDDTAGVLKVSDGSSWSAVGGAVTTTAPATGNGSAGSPISVQAASATQSGVVTTGGQTLEGEKTFLAQMTFDRPASSNAMLVKEGSIQCEGSAEQQIVQKRFGTYDLTTDPTFKLGRIVAGGTGYPIWRIIYQDANTSPAERTVFAVESVGTVAAVADNVRRSLYEGYLKEGDVQPLFRLTAYPDATLEFGAGGALANDADVHIRRNGANRLDLNLGIGGAETVRASLTDTALTLPGSVKLVTKSVEALSPDALSLKGNSGMTLALGDGVKATVNGDNITFGTGIRLHTHRVVSDVNAPLWFQGWAVSGSGNPGVILDNVNWMNTAGDKLVSIRNTGTEVAYSDKDGGLFSPLFRAFGAASAAVKGAIADSSSAVGVIIDNVVALVTTGAKLLSIRNNGTEKSYFDKDGGLAVTGVAAGNPGVTLPTQVSFKSGACTFGSDSTGNSAQIGVSSSSNNLTIFCQTKIGAARTRSCLDIAAAGKHTWSSTGFGDGSATVGAVTINAPAGYATVAAGASSVAITCNLVTANTIARAFQVGGIDATLGAYIGSTVSGSVITLQFAANATANRKIFFELLLD
jgi:hypothetical protein